MPDAVAAGCSYTYNDEIYIFGGRMVSIQISIGDIRPNPIHGRS